MSTMSLLSFLVALSLISSSVAWVPSRQSPRKLSSSSELSYSANDYLSSLGIDRMMEPLSSEFPLEAKEQSNAVSHALVTFLHASSSYFDVGKMTPKGPRSNADVGQPHDATRTLVDADTTSVGSWWCASGGWPSPKLRETTEIFYVLSGHGRVTDTDGTQHYFGPGDTVILPKGWSGRWDVLIDIHKVWVVYEHDKIEETSNPIRAVIVNYNSLAPQYKTDDAKAWRTILYQVGPTRVGCDVLRPCSSPVARTETKTTQCFHVLEGRFFLTNADGSARRCEPGDTIVIPKGWTGGYWDVIEPVKTLWVETL